MMREEKICVAIAPINIAVIKYWGKRDEKLILPINDSVSVTLSEEDLHTKTKVVCSKDFATDRMWLNGKEEDVSNVRIQICLNEIRQRSPFEEYKDYRVHIYSINNFPTKAGLASSASGYACLVKAVAEAYGVKEDLSWLARQGSGSACRSMYGGFVHWQMGSSSDGRDSVAVQIRPKEHWPELRAMILIVNSAQKEIGSTDGMRRSVLTSNLLHYRKSIIVPDRVQKIIEAIKVKDFQKFAELTMMESNQFHAVCLDTYPPIHYLNDTSYKVISLIHSYNSHYNRNKVAYTFDAGPNPCLYLLEEDMQEVLEVVKHFFPLLAEEKSIIGSATPLPCSPDSLEILKSLSITPEPPGLIKMIINTQVGSGPYILPEDEHELEETGSVI